MRKCPELMSARANILAAVVEAQAMEILADLRLRGWMVAAHNDYTKDGKLFTFWLMAKDERCVKGEGRNDYAALKQIADKIELYENKDF